MSGLDLLLAAAKTLSKSAKKDNSPNRGFRCGNDNCPTKGVTGINRVHGKAYLVRRTITCGGKTHSGCCQGAHLRARCAANKNTHPTPTPKPCPCSVFLIS